MSRPILAFGVLLVLLVVGCGGVEDETITVVHYEHEAANSSVASAIFAYVNAVARADGKGACGWLTKGQAQAERRQAKFEFGVNAGSCAEALSWIGAHLAPAVRAARFAVTGTRIEGKRATARLVGSGAHFRLLRRDGGWLIAQGAGLWSSHPPGSRAAGEPAA